MLASRPRHATPCRHAHRNRRENIEQKAVLEVMEHDLGPPPALVSHASI
jgi:hypothetical protein